MTPERSRVATVVLVALSLVLAVWVTAGAGPVTVVDTGTPPSAAEQQRELRERGAVDLEQPPPAQQEAGEIPAWFDVALWVFGLLLATLIVAWLAWAGLDAFRARRWRRRAAAPDQEGRAEVVHDAMLDDAHRELQQATTGQLAALRQGTPRNAIVACWIALEEAVERAGVPRNPAETSTELVQRVTHEVAVDDGVASALAALYREARFSRHELTEQHRERAITLLAELADQLARADRRRDRASAVADSDGRS